MARPKGTKNRSYPYVAHVPAVCRKCGSHDLLSVEGYTKQVTENAGTLPTGFAYRAVERQLKECADCGQRYVRMSFIGEQENTKNLS